MYHNIDFKSHTYKILILKIPDINIILQLDYVVEIIDEMMWYYITLNEE